MEFHTVREFRDKAQPENRRSIRAEPRTSFTPSELGDFATLIWPISMA